MNDLIRPTLYQAWMDIVPLVEQSGRETKTYDVVGPVCESGDWLGKERSLAIASDDLLAVRTAGAYGFTMASNYNSRPRAAELMIDGVREYVIRTRERSEEHTSELQSLMRISYAVFCLKKKKTLQLQ